MGGKMKLFNEKNGVCMKMLVGLGQAMIFATILLPFAVASNVNLFFEIREDFRLVGHVIETSISDEFECSMRCSKNVKCRSYNLPSNGHLGNKTCEMNDQTQRLKPKDLRPIKGFIYYEKANRGWFSYQPGHSCKDILDSGHTRGDGEYWIDPENNGNPLSVYCDMTTDGGGWLLIYNIVINGTSLPPSTLGVETSYRGMSHYNNDNMLLATGALKELRYHLSFTQLRFHCSKQAVHRAFHVATLANDAGETVVKYFSRQTAVMPDACGSFATLPGDNSVTADHCASWGTEGGVYQVGKWGHEGIRELFTYPAFVAPGYHWATYLNTWECDDTGDSNSVSPGDFWKIYVR